MADSGEAPDKAVVTEALVLAFSNSEARTLVGTDALRGVLDVEYHDIVHDGAFDLQQVWELLEEQPGFDPVAVTPPICLFKSWEDRLGLEVHLPDHLATRTAKELALEAAKCPIGPSELQRVLRLGTKRVARPAAAPVHDVVPPAGGTSQRSRPALLAAASVVALVCFVFAGYNLKKGCSGPAWQEVSVSDFVDIPVSGARRLGAEVGVQLSDAAWLGLPEESRRKQLEQALHRLESKRIDSLFVEDREGRVVATAQFFDEPRRIRIRFP